MKDKITSIEIRVIIKIRVKDSFVWLHVIFFFFFFFLVEPRIWAAGAGGVRACVRKCNKIQLYKQNGNINNNRMSGKRFINPKAY